MSRPPPYAAPSRQTRTHADCLPRRSPPAASPASSAARSRRTSGAARARAIGVEHRPHDVLAGEDVPLHGDLAVDDPARPGEALVSGVVGRAAREVDHAELAARRELVVPDELGDDVGRGAARAQQRKPVRAVGEVRERLGRDRARIGAAPRDGVPNGEALRSNGDAAGLTLRLERDDRERHGRDEVGLVRRPHTRPVDARNAGVLYSGLSRMKGARMVRRIGGHTKAKGRASSAALAVLAAAFLVGTAGSASAPKTRRDAVPARQRRRRLHGPERVVLHGRPVRACACGAAT